MTRDQIITRLAERFGPHKRYSAVTRSLVPDGDDAEACCMAVFTAQDGHNSLRSLTYGEIADALAEPGHVLLSTVDPDGMTASQRTAWLRDVPDDCSCDYLWTGIVWTRSGSDLACELHGGTDGEG
jgi:hypothetical protein